MMMSTNRCNYYGTAGSKQWQGTGADIPDNSDFHAVPNCLKHEFNKLIDKYLYTFMSIYI
jgi:hypothetical protein